MSAPFHFKQFSIFQDTSPFKVGTDAVLLGSWAPVTKGGHYLDIGTGTGILASMLAQRGAGKITAVEPDLQAANMAKINFENLPFTCDISLMTTSMEQLVLQEKADGIVCNPPYFFDHTPNPNLEKVTARHADKALPDRWCRLWKNGLRETGTVALVLPVHVVSLWDKALNTNQFYLEKILWVKSVENGKNIRLLGQWQQHKPQIIQEEHLFLYEEDKKSRSTGYAHLTKDFYL